MAIANSFYSEQVHGPLEYFSLGNFQLEKGGTLRDCRIAYATLGTLSPKKDNVVLLPHMYSGSSMHMRTFLTGNGRALDPARYFIILPNMLGNGLSTAQHASPFQRPGIPEADVRRRRQRAISLGDREIRD